MTPEQALEAIKNETDQIVGEEAHALFSRLVKASPVDTGYFKQSWKAPKQTGWAEFRIHNSAEYATILSAGYRDDILGRAYGSKQWYGGLDPMLGVTNNILQRRLDGIKY